MKRTALTYRMVNVVNEFGSNPIKHDAVTGVNMQRLISYGIPLIRISGKVFSAIFGCSISKNEKNCPQVLRDERAQQIWW